MKTVASNQRIYQKIVHIIKEQINDGTYQVGDALPSERDLAKQLQVSRTSVREAIIALEVSNLVEVKIGSGVYVKSLSVNQTQHAYPTADLELLELLNEKQEIAPFSLLQARLLIEPECAYLAAKNMTPDVLLSIKEAYLKNVEDNVMGSATHVGDRLFHIRIAEASGNDAYAFLIRQLLTQQYGELFKSLQRLYTPKDMPLRSQHEHFQLLQALEEKNAKVAKSAMQQHLKHVIDIFMRHADFV